MATLNLNKNVGKKLFQLLHKICKRWGKRKMCKKKEVKTIKRPVAAAAEAACQGNGREPPASICEMVRISFAIAIAISTRSTFLCAARCRRKENS